MFRDARSQRISCISSPHPLLRGNSSSGAVFQESGRFTVTPFVNMSYRLVQPELRKGPDGDTNRPSVPLEGACVPAEKLAKMLGESCLMADLGPLLRMKQEKAVQEAVEKRSTSSDTQQTTASYVNRVASQESLFSACTPTPREAEMKKKAARQRSCALLTRVQSRRY